MTRDEHEILVGLLESFLDDSLIVEVLDVLQGGKEATVFRCRAAPSTGRNFFAAKVYRPMDRRNFRNDGVYQAGRVIVNQRTKRAYENRTAFGRGVQYGRWVNSEFATQRALFAAGCAVPRAIACNGSAIVMDWIGDDATGAPAIQLRHAKLARGEAERLCDALLWNVELMLRHDIVHGDLSPFNVLYESAPRDDGTGDDSRVTVIDFPQAVDARSNRNASALLYRDVNNVCDHFAKFGVQRDAGRITSKLWQSFLHSRW